MAEQRYRVIKRLEAGGMAEVFLGEAISVQGFKKQVAIKRVLPHLAQNRNFMAMFLDEARLGASLSHANIVTVFDIGAADNTFFLVMEYIEGTNLKTALEVMRGQGRRFRLQDAIYLGIETCRGLSYAHDLADEHGELLHLVHRDVSPPNILLSKRGEVKVTDFGLAKARTQLEKTDPGVVKGKFSYLAPETAMGQEVDARTDIFALGIIVWEILAGRRLFMGESDYQTIKLVQRAEVPSLRMLHPDVNEEFEGVLLKALAREPHDRYQSAREFSDALTDYLFKHNLKVTAYDIANLVQLCMQDRARSGSSVSQPLIDRMIFEEIQRFTSIDELSDPLHVADEAVADADEGAQPLDSAMFDDHAARSGTWHDPASADLASLLEQGQPPSNAEAMPRGAAAAGQAAPKSSKRAPQRGVWFAAALAVLGVAGATVWYVLGMPGLPR